MQNTSPGLKEYFGRTFRYEFLQELILEEFFVNIKKSENHNLHDFQDEFFSGSSDFDVEMFRNEKL